MPELDHLSYSSISSYLMCGAAWRMRYIDKLPAPTSPELVFGSAFHGAIEKHLGQGIDLIAAWREAWKDQLDKNAEIAWDDTTPEIMGNEGIRILSHVDILAGLAAIKPALNADGSPALETKVTLRVPGVPIPIIGYIDVITTDGVPGDFKTSARSWTQDKANGEIQTLFYLAALNQASIQVPDWMFRHYIFVKTKTPQFQLLTHSHSPSQVFWLFGMIKNVWKAIEAEAYPENPSSWKCSPSYCEYWSRCRGKWS